ncbi:MAG TPA: hypothetical protein VJS39_13380, partial [Gemmatimonadaceae bacterium]|nr:hypothetical protein [Gemmatimonadaceae bacterium]
MIKRIAPVAMLFAAACGGGKDGTGPVQTLSDISSMSVGEVRVLNPTDIPNGITLPQASGNRDYVIIVGNTSTLHDVAANYTIKADKSPTSTFGIEVAASMSAQSSRQIGGLQLARTPEEAVHNKVRAFERSGLSLRSRSRVAPSSTFSIRRSAQAVASPVPAVGDSFNVKIPDASTNNL